MDPEIIFAGPTCPSNTIDAVSLCATDTALAMNRAVSRRATGSNSQSYGTPGEERLSTWDILTAYSAALSGGALE